MHVGRGSQYTSGQLARIAREHNWPAQSPARGVILE